MKRCKVGCDEGGCQVTAEQLLLINQCLDPTVTTGLAKHYPRWKVNSRFNAGLEIYMPARGANLTDLLAMLPANILIK